MGMDEFQLSETERLLFALLKMALHEQKEEGAWTEIAENTC